MKANTWAENVINKLRCKSFVTSYLNPILLIHLFFAITLCSWNDKRRILYCSIALEKLYKTLYIEKLTLKMIISEISTGKIHARFIFYDKWSYAWKRFVCEKLLVKVSQRVILTQRCTRVTQIKNNRPRCNFFLEILQNGELSARRLYVLSDASFVHFRDTEY